jgi:tetratricopeptide (TPR) repeat protein
VADNNRVALLAHMGLAEKTISYLDEAISDQPNRADLFLWRGMVYHAIDQLEQARRDYETALDMQGTGALSEMQMAKANIALGWIHFRNRKLISSLKRFSAAKRFNERELEAYIGRGYAFYEARLYRLAYVEGEAAVTEGVASLTDGSGAVNGQYISEAAGLAAAAHWKLGEQYKTNLGANPLACAEYEQALDRYTQAAVHDWSLYFPDHALASYEGRPQTDRLATFLRARGILLWLLDDRDCWWPQGTDDQEKARIRESTLHASVVSLDLAQRFEPMNADYIHMRARLQTAQWVFGKQERVGDQEKKRRVAPLDEWLNPIVDFLGLAILLRPTDAGKDNYAPNWFTRDVLLPIVFNDALYALRVGEATRALSIFHKGLEAATFVKLRGLVPAADALLGAVVQADPDTLESIVALYRDMVDGAVTNAKDEMNEVEAMKVGLIYMVLEDVPTASKWYNEAVRRSQIGGRRTVNLDNTGAKDLRDLWTSHPGTAAQLSTRLDLALVEQLQRYPDLARNVDYWRNRTWFRFYLARAAFLAGDESGARVLLDASIRDVETTKGVNKSEGYSSLDYIPEGAWGWYHVLRAREAEARGNHNAALADYEASWKHYNPIHDDTVRVEKQDAAFHATKLAFSLGKVDRAKDWFNNGVGLGPLSEREDKDVREIREMLASLLCEIEQQVRQQRDPEIETLYTAVADTLGLALRLDDAVFCFAEAVHIGDQVLKHWAPLNSTCWTATFDASLATSDSAMSLSLQLFGAEGANWVELNQVRIADLPAQARQDMDQPPNYWGERLNIPLPRHRVEVGANRLRICAAPLSPLDDDLDDFQVKGIWITAGE